METQCTETNSLGIPRCQEILRLAQDFAWRLRRRQNRSTSTARRRATSKERAWQRSAQGDRWRHSGRKQCTETNSLGILRCQEILPLRPTQGQDFAWRLRRRQNGSRCTTSQLIRTMKCASISHASGREQGEFIENKANSERLVLGT